MKNKLADSEEKGALEDLGFEYDDEEGEDESLPVNVGDGRFEVNGQRFYPEVEAQELGAARYLRGLMLSE